ncbi:MAG: hypothetical protein HGA78_10080 [Nitrospirales bacterium]|nr:hypothetical protein [Nitrospirales bacterium]
MELHREIRAFTIKVSTRRSGEPLQEETRVGLWELSHDIPITSIETKKDEEIIFHSDMEFSLANWDNAIAFLRSTLSLLKVKRGYIFVRKIIGSPDSLKTEIETYKVTKRGVYYTDPSGSPELLKDIMRFSGRNKRLRQAEHQGNLDTMRDKGEK